MKICLSLVHVTAALVALVYLTLAQTDLPQPRILTLSVEPGQAVTLHLRPGYVSSVRMPEAVGSVVVGDPGAFRAEHSENEPQLVFFKAITPKPMQTNALITTKEGHQVALTLASQGKSDRGGDVDYVLTCERPRSFIIAPNHSSLLISETKNLTTADAAIGTLKPPQNQNRNLLDTQPIQSPHWEGKDLRVSIGPSAGQQQQMAVKFAVLNSSARTIELLPPQVELAGASRDKHHRAIKSEPIPVKDFWMTSRQLAPGDRADGVVAFDRPTFKESRERLMLVIAQAEAVDRPVRVPITFVASVAGGAK